MAKKEIKQYEIGGRKFWQGLASAGQLEHLWPMIVELVGDDPKGKEKFAERMHKEVYRLMCILLVPEGETRMDLMDRLDLEGGTKELEKFFRAESEPSDIENVTTDFLTLNPRALGYIMTLKNLEKGILRTEEVNQQSSMKDSDTLISRLSMPSSSQPSLESQEKNSVEA